MQNVGNVQIPDIALRAMLSIIAGLLAGLVMPATIRVSRSFMLAAQSPPATARFVSFGLPQLLRIQIAAALPFLAALAWVSQTSDTASTFASLTFHFGLLI